MTRRKKLLLMAVVGTAIYFFNSGCDPAPTAITPNGVVILSVPDAGVTCYVYAGRNGISCLRDAP
jgi:hypothetical protein